MKSQGLKKSKENFKKEIIIKVNQVHREKYFKRGIQVMKLTENLVMKSQKHII